MNNRGRVKRTLFLLACLFLPPLFPFYYVRYLAKSQNKHKIAIYTAGASYLCLWLLIFVAALIPTSPAHDYRPYTSDYIADNYQAKSQAYQDAFYEKLRATQLAESTQTDNLSKSNTNQTSNQTTSKPSVSSTNNTTNNTSNTTTTSSAMSGIRIAEADNSPYRRADYGSGWNVGQGCNIRSRLLIAQSTVKTTTASNGCTVTYGVWIDPYSGAKLVGNPYQGDGTSNDLDIDHIIPLRYVNQHGGYAWSSDQKHTYAKSLSAMNNGVYLAVSATENRRKSDQGPADYYPSNPSYYCEYSRRWRNIARTYSIALSSRDYNKIKEVLTQCNIK